AGMHAGAVALWEKQVTREREAFGRIHQEMVASLKGLAQLHELREDFAAARKVREEVLAISAGLYGEKHWRGTDARFELRGVERLAEIGRAGRGRLDRARAQSDEAVGLIQAGEARKAIAVAHEVLAVRKELLGERHPTYLATLNILALMYKDKG